MKKLFIGFALGLALLPHVTFAAVSDEQYQSLIRTLIGLLQQQVVILTQQLAEMQAQSTTLNAIQTKVSTPAYPLYSAVPQQEQQVPILPPIVKELRFVQPAGITDCDVSILIGQENCNVIVSYFENGERTAATITVSSDDSGVLQPRGAGSTGNPASMQTTVQDNQGNRVAWFTYRPTATGTRRITASANGITKTNTSLGQYVPQE